MNGVPPPADLTKLKNILGSAKAVMNKVDNGNYETGNVNGDAFTQNTEGYVSETNVKTSTQAQTMGNATRQMKQPNKEAILNSKMPEEIKKAMLENPIKQPTMGHTFNLDDVSDPQTDQTEVIAQKALKQAKNIQKKVEVIQLIYQLQVKELCGNRKQVSEISACFKVIRATDSVAIFKVHPWDILR